MKGGCERDMVLQEMRLTQIINFLKKNLWFDYCICLPFPWRINENFFKKRHAIDVKSDVRCFKSNTTMHIYMYELIH